MNNSTIRLDSFEPPSDELRLKSLRELEGKNIRIISAIEEIQKTAAWSSLKEIIFDGLVSGLEKSALEEATKGTPEPLKLSRIAGELTWARRFADLTGYANEKRSELLAIREQLYGKSENRG